MRTIRGGAALAAGLTISMMAANSRIARAADACQPACEAGQSCVDGACAPAAAGKTAAPAGEATPKVAAAAPARAPSTAPLWREGILVVPSIGLHSVEGDAGQGKSAGLHAGIITGSRMGENWSLNIGAAFDLLNFDTPPGASLSGYVLDIGFNPLFHLPEARFEVIAGPILGSWASYGHGSGLGPSVDNWAYGWVLGLDAGVLMRVGASAKLGALLSFSARNPMKTCVSIAGGTDTCVSDNLDSMKTLVIALAAMF